MKLVRSPMIKMTVSPKGLTGGLSEDCTGEVNLTLQIILRDAA
jgi:hypothetical protein